MANPKTPFEPPRWLRDLVRFLPLKSQFVLSGNVRDLQVAQLAPGICAPQSLLDTLAATLRDFGYSSVLVYEPLAGFRALPRLGDEASDAPGLAQLGLVSASGAAPAGLQTLTDSIERVVMSPGTPIALIIDYASRLVTRPSEPPPDEYRLFTRALMLSLKARSRPHGNPVRPFFNSVLWIVEREGNLPDWFLVENPRVRHIPIAKPDRIQRQFIAGALIKPIAPANSTADELQSAQDSFTDSTEGMLLLDMNAIAVLAQVEGVQLARIGDAVRRYKVGVTEDPWMKLDQDKIRGAERFVQNRVKGQQPAVTHMLDIVKRALTGVGAGKRGNRPRGVAFLAGPTGVGKTELAKTITSLLFGDESAYIRFDMSEFAAEHSDQRLLGAPPGYIGYDAGGELTNAIREKPFSVVLFDEIEKAHPRVLDKFLQILDDGVLTSGRGDRVYFSEALIVFTSNLGIYKRSDNGERVTNVTPDQSYEKVREGVLNEIESHFKFVLNRPEILNRIGENIIIFDFIRPGVALEIFESMVDATLKDLAAQRRIVELAQPARDALRALCLADLTNGGRGIRNHLEAYFINPLARAVFDEQIGEDHPCHVVELSADGLKLTKV